MDTKMAKQYIKENMLKARDFHINIIIGPAVALFKKMYEGDYYTITTADDVRGFMEKWTAPTNKPIVFEDISLMTPAVQTYLLKFIEDSPSPLVILASRDNVSPIILSRCKNIVKVPYEVPTPSRKMADLVKLILDNKEEIKASRLTGEKVDPIDPLLESFNTCPEYWYRYSNPNITRPRGTIDKYLSLLDYE